MDLKSAVEKYLQVVTEFNQPMPLARFGVSRQEIEKMLAAWDEDYQLHRHMELIAPSGTPPGNSEEIYLVRGIPYTAILFKESIRHVFE